jgi:hypothetical protein
MADPTASSPTPSAYPQNAMNLGGPVYPWLQPYGGNFAAPMSPWQTAGLGAYSNFVGGGAGTNPASNYYGNELSGQYLTPGSNPWLSQIEQSGQSIKDYQDQQAIKQIQSSMAAGGNALSGATGNALGNYLNQSGANFQNIMGGLMNQDYQMERGLQQGAAQGSLGAANQYGNSVMNMFGMGAIPQQIANQDVMGQYQDFLRQTQGYQNAFNYPQQLALQELHSGYPGSAPPNYGTSQATGWAALLPALFGGGAGGGSGAIGGIGNLLSNLFGGGGGGGGGGWTGSNTGNYENMWNLPPGSLGTGTGDYSQEFPGSYSGYDPTYMPPDWLQQYYGSGGT